MLFVVMADGKLLVVELCGFGFWWQRNDRIGNRIEVVLGMLLGALVTSAGMGMKGNMVAVVVAANE
jgi:hypothetical protein